MTGIQTAVQVASSVLGKRKTRSKSLVLHIASSPEPQYTSDSDYAPANASGSSTGKIEVARPILVNGRLLGNDKKRYRCTHDDCEKAFSKPSRLEEHERSHTGERPFVCTVCSKSYLRDTHLQAHSRSHLPDSSRPYACSVPGCNKRFWTNQHLRVHHDWHNGAKAFTCTVENCTAAFAKHNQLRLHVCEVHSPPGTKPYQCDHPGCQKSFSMNQHLRTHMKTHDEKRYTCSYPSCATSETQSYFPTWTKLQHHIRTIHPPMCEHPSCRGRIFASQKGLRAHQKLHDEREIEANLGKASLSLSDQADADEPPKKRRRGGDLGRDWICDFDSCGKDFKSKKALTTHKNVTHLGRRDHMCPHDQCHRAFGYKHLLQRHIAKTHSISASACDPNSESEDHPDSEALSPDMDIDALSGYAYALKAEKKLATARALRCPFPDLEELVAFEVESHLPGTCDYVFGRAYDLRRHLRARHGIDAEKAGVEEWVNKRRNASKPATAT